MRLTRASLLTKIVILALLIIAAISLLELSSRIDQAQGKKEELTQMVAAQTQVNADLEDAIEHSDDPAWIIKVAREKLGLVEPGEITFFDIGG